MVRNTFEIPDRRDGERTEKRWIQGDLAGILDFHQPVINEAKDMPVFIPAGFTGWIRLYK